MKMIDQSDKCSKEAGVTMDPIHTKKGHVPSRILMHEKGRTYYSKQTERKILFVFTLIMLLAGVLVKLGIF